MTSELPDVEDSVNYNEETNTYWAAFDMRKTNATLAVITVMASVLEKDPTDLKPLLEVVDPEALNQLMQPQEPGPHASDRTVKFRYHSHEVRILSYGIIKVQPITSEK